MRTTVKADGTPELDSGRELQLVVVGPGTMATFPVSETGELTIGRALEATVRIEDALTSRLHARLCFRDGEWHLEDLGSSNGTRFDDLTLKGESAVIFPGDTFTIGSTLLMLQELPRTGPVRRVWTHAYFVARIEEECQRGKENDTPFVIARIQFDGPLSGEDVASLLAPCLRGGDLLASYGGRDYEVLRPGTPGAEAPATQRSIETTLAKAKVTARVALAAFPADGRMADVLFARVSGRLRAAASAENGPERTGGGIVVADRQMADIYRIAEVAAPAMASVLITGETGVGKDVLARFIHDHSKRKNAPFVHIDLAALSDTLADSELFGHEKGAFTGATKSKAGLLETAKGGTVFLNEIGELPAALQGKLLRAIQDRRVRRLGDNADREIDVRWIAATNKNLRAAIAAGGFRDDLYFRLAVVTLVVPPLRDRTGEIEPLVRSFVKRFCAANGRPVLEVDPETITLLETYEWPGNIRELANVVERAVVLCEGSVIGPEHLAETIQTGAGRSGRDRAAPGGFASTERDRVLAALEQQRWRITEAARILGVGRTTLWKRMKALGIPNGRGAAKAPEPK